MLFSETESYISNQKLFTHADKLLLAVSGGADSMAMTHILHKHKYDISVAHCNFNLRGSESDTDEAFIRDFCTKSNIPFFSTAFDTKKHASETKASIEMAARELRYSWFEELCAKHQFNKIAVAHNSNDVVETFFINLTRGTGIKGLCSIQPQNENIVRPLLFANRQQIESYLSENNINFRTDSSNAENDYLRNKFRNIILPEIEKFSPSFMEQAQQTIGYVNDAEKIFRQKIDEVADGVSHTKGDITYINTDKLQQHSPFETYLHELIKPYGFNSDQCKQISTSLNNQRGKCFIAKEYELITGKGTIEIKKAVSGQEGIIYLHPDTETTSPLHLSISGITPIGELEIIKQKQYAYFDADKLSFPLTLRKWQTGDKMKPFGMKGRSKKVSDIFTDLKYSKFDKENAWLLCSEDTILWFVGERASEWGKITEKTEHVVTFQLTLSK